MKTILNSIWSWLEAFGQARAAASLARQGRIEEAKAVYTTNMNLLDTVIMLLRWRRNGWEVHPINLQDEFHGWF